MLKLGNWSDKALLVSRCGAIGAALVLPFSTVLTNVGLAVFLLGWLASCRFVEDWRRIKTHSTTLVALGLLLIFIVSALWADVPFKLSWAEISKYRKLLVLALLTVVFWQSVVWKDRMVTALFVSHLVLAVLCVGIAMNFPGLPHMMPGQGAVYRNHIAQGVEMAALVLLGLHWLAYGDRTWKRIVGIVGVVLGVVCAFYLANGRTGYVCVAVVLLLGGLCLLRSFKLKLVAIVAIVAAVLMMGITSDRVQHRILNVQQDIAKLEQGNIESSSGLRITFWKQSLEMVKGAPVLGVGAGAWGKHYMDGIGQRPEKLETGNPHNEYLNVAAQTGLVGLALLMFFFWKAYRFGRALTSGDRWLMTGFLGMFIAGCLFNSLIFNFTEGNLFAMLVGVLLSQTQSPEKVSEEMHAG